MIDTPYQQLELTSAVELPNKLLKASSAVIVLPDFDEAERVEAVEHVIHAIADSVVATLTNEVMNGFRLTDYPSAPEREFDVNACRLDHKLWKEHVRKMAEHVVAESDVEWQDSLLTRNSKTS
jgi:hypothetical protein